MNQNNVFRSIYWPCLTGVILFILCLTQGVLFWRAPHADAQGGQGSASTAITINGKTVTAKENQVWRISHSEWEQGITEPIGGISFGVSWKLGDSANGNSTSVTFHKFPLRKGRYQNMWFRPTQNDRQSGGIDAQIFNPASAGYTLFRREYAPPSGALGARSTGGSGSSVIWNQDGQTSAVLIITKVTSTFIEGEFSGILEKRGPSAKPVPTLLPIRLRFSWPVKIN